MASEEDPPSGGAGPDKDRASTGKHSAAGPEKPTYPWETPDPGEPAKDASFEDEPVKDRLLAGLIAANEPRFAEQWQNSPEGFRR